MIIESCRCDGLPAHDHFAGHHMVNGVMVPRYDPDPVRFWVDWREYARALALGDQWDDPRHGQ